MQILRDRIAHDLIRPSSWRSRVYEVIQAIVRIATFIACRAAKRGIPRVVRLAPIYITDATPLIRRWIANELLFGGLWDPAHLNSFTCVR